VSLLNNLVQNQTQQIAIFNTSEQSSAFNHEYESWASEPKARTPMIRVIKRTFAHACRI
jgi:hypothetical protein